MRHATCNVWHKLQEIYLFKFNAACIEYSLVAAERIISLPLTCFLFLPVAFCIIFITISLCVACLKIEAIIIQTLFLLLCFFLLFFCFCAAYLVFFCAAEKLVCQFAGVSVRFCPGGNCLLDFPLLVICCCCCCCLSLLIALCNCVCANCESYF